MKAEKTVIPWYRKPWTYGQVPDSVMAMIYVQPVSLSAGLLQALAKLTSASLMELSRQLLSGDWQVYEVGTLTVVVNQYEQTLHIQAIFQHGKPGSYFRDLTVNLLRLARAWNCTNIQTNAYDARVQKLLKTVGAKTVGWIMQLEVGCEQQKEN